jgi:hypothetical protein
MLQLRLTGALLQLLIPNDMNFEQKTEQNLKSHSRHRRPIFSKPYAPACYPP